MKSKKRWPTKKLLLYGGSIALSLLVAVLAGWTTLAQRIDNYAYDYLFNRYPPANWTPSSVIVALDETALNKMGGQRNYRPMLTAALERIAAAKPRAVAIDMILADKIDDESQDRQLAAAMRATPNLILATELIGDRVDNLHWENPLPQFRAAAAAVGEVYTDRNKLDGVSRFAPLAQSIPGDRRWAFSLEAFRVSRGGGQVIETPDDLEVAGVRVPVSYSSGRALRIRFRRDGIPKLPLYALTQDPSLAAQLTGKVVFIGVTANSAARDRLVNPYGEDVAGVEVNAQIYETLAQGRFLVSARNDTSLLFCVLIATAAGFTFALRSGLAAYLIAGLLLLVAHFLPSLLFQQGIVPPYFSTISAAWLSVTTAAAFQYFTTRGELRKSESDRARYQQAIHFVTHEMRTPLTAIQGSSELMGRYNLTDDKRKQMAQMINSESKRLARMIQTFLDVERLSDGQMEMKREPFVVREVIEGCVARVRALAERKQINIYVDSLTADLVLGDRELMEYAVYNLLTNAVKYSPPQTEVHVETVRQGEDLHLAVRDQGIGMDSKELKNIFKKFYRTKKAEQSGEVGTGIGLSIVEQIVVNHGGRMEVASAPSKGSTFTIVVPAQG